MDPMKFTSLIRLLDGDDEGKDRVTVGALATAIEREGVHGWDRFGRFNRHKPDSPEAQAVLDALAAYGASDADEPMEDDGTGVFSRYGWPVELLPTFEKWPDLPMPPRPSVRADNANLRIIGALLCYIKGEIPHSGPFKSEADLIDTLLDGMGPGYPGISRRTLEGKFMQAKALLRS